MHYAASHLTVFFESPGGYIVSGGTFVGRWRDCVTPEEYVGYEGQSARAGVQDGLGCINHVVHLQERLRCHNEWMSPDNPSLRDDLDTGHLVLVLALDLDRLRLVPCDPLTLFVSRIRLFVTRIVKSWRSVPRFHSGATHHESSGIFIRSCRDDDKGHDPR